MLWCGGGVYMFSIHFHLRSNRHTYIRAKYCEELTKKQIELCPRTLSRDPTILGNEAPNWYAKPGQESISTVLFLYHWPQLHLATTCRKRRQNQRLRGALRPPRQKHLQKPVHQLRRRCLVHLKQCMWSELHWPPKRIGGWVRYDNGCDWESRN